MALRSPDVPTLSYVVAAVVGVFGLPFMLLAASFVAEISDSGFHDFGLVVSLSFGVVHLVLGGVFGFIWPEAGWRWGVWLCGLPACLVSYYRPDAWFFANWLLMTALPACAGAHLAARLHFKYTEVG